MKIVVLDLGKFNTMCCLFDSKTRKHEFLTAATNRDYLAFYKTGQEGNQHRWLIHEIDLTNRIF